MRLLILGSLAGPLGAASRIAIDRGARVLHAEDVEAALRSLRAGEGADMVLADVRLDVGALMASLTSERISVPVVACGAGTDTRAAVAAVKAGAREYLPLPPDPELIGALLAAVSRTRHAIVHADPRMAELLQTAGRIAGSDASVLITGPSGTGKELVARFVHTNSRRAKARFVAVNCAAIPESLLESELFGHEKGAFTGAVARRLGRFEEADGGTLLLDEISEMDIRLQAKLLRAIQEREIDRVGGSQPVKVDVRILATSNRDLGEEVARGRFRADLFYRLDVVSLQIPALADRPGDVGVLARHFAEKYARADGLPDRPLSPEASRKLQAHDWPGNVRELENTMHRAVLLATGPRIDADAIVLSARPSGMAAGVEPRVDVVAGTAVRPLGGRSPVAGTRGIGAGGGTMGGAGGAAGIGSVGRTVADVERDLIIDTLRHCFGNRTHAANILGISIRTLRNKLRQYAEEGTAVPAPGEHAAVAGGAGA